MLNVTEFKKSNKNSNQTEEKEKEVTHIFIYWD